MFFVPIFLFFFGISMDFLRKKAFFIISIVSSIGTLVNSDSTSMEMIKFSFSILILLTLLMKSNESLSVYLKRFFNGAQPLLLLLLLLLLTILVVCEIVWSLKFSSKMLQM
jgi:hypothetical protein